MGYGLLFLTGIFTSVQSVLKLLAGVKAEEIKPFDKKTIELQDGKQLIKSKLEINKYPNISVKKGIPVRWEIEAGRDALTYCNYRMILRDFQLSVEMGYGTNVEF